MRTSIIKRYRTTALLPLLCLATVLWGVGSLTAIADDFIWIEGEAPKASNMNRHPWWYDQVDKGQLSEEIGS